MQVRVGEDDGDPVFCVTDLLPHLGTEQMKRPATEVIKGEDLNLLIGSRPFRDDEGSDLVKLNIRSCFMRNTALSRPTSCRRSWKSCPPSGRGIWALIGA